MMNKAYVLYLIKIGMTSREDILQRMRELYTTGVPGPFTCLYAAVVDDYEKVEKDLHRQYAQYRYNPRREFFDMDSAEVIAFLKTIAIRDVTKQVDNAVKRVAKERPATREKQLALFEVKERARRAAAPKKCKTVNKSVGAKSASLVAISPATGRPRCKFPQYRHKYMGFKNGDVFKCNARDIIVAGERTEVLLDGKPMLLNHAVDLCIERPADFRHIEYCYYKNRKVSKMYDEHWEADGMVLAPMPPQKPRSKVAK